MRLRCANKMLPGSENVARPHHWFAEHVELQAGFGRMTEMLPTPPCRQVPRRATPITPLPSDVRGQRLGVVRAVPPSASCD